MLRLDENALFRGIVQFLHIVLPSGCLENKHVASDAAIAASKLQHQHRAVYAQESATAAADEARVVHVVHGTTGVVKAIKAGCVVACLDNATIAVDLLKNGVSILTEEFDIDSGDAAYALVAGVIDTDTLEIGDVLEIAVDGTVGAGTLGKGVFAYIDFYEDAA